MVEIPGRRDEETRIGRRTYLAAVGAVGVGALAGCSGGGGGSSDGGDGGDDNGPEAPQAVADHLSNTDNFDGTMVDRTGSDEVTIKVGVKGNGGFWAFRPPAVTVSSGTTVVWEWTGKGNASHNVVAKDGSYESDLYSSEGKTFEQTFDSAGTSLYYCVPHRSSGMKGAIVVE